jgi:outer membrane protein assembly factor BamD (BamD/ComL family)
MKIRFLSLAMLFTIVLAGCNSKEEARQTIQQAEKELYGKNDQMDFKEKKVDKAIDAYQSFAENYQNDSLAPEYLFKAADLYRLKEEPKKALDIYQKIRDDHPDFRKAPHCLFLQGFVYENEIGNMDKAKTKYQAFIDSYPEHDLADDARFSLKNLGKSPEDIIDQFEKSEQEAKATSQKQESKQN